MRWSIEVARLVKRYSANTPVAVDGVSFEVAPGEIFCLLGPNGSGKSTTLGVLGTLVEPTSGRVAVAGHDVVQRPDEVRKRIGLVLQDAGVDPPFARGAYSYAPPGAKQAYGELAAPTDGRLFWAGEATNTDDPMTVHGALDSGWRAAEQLTGHTIAVPG